MTTSNEPAATDLQWASAQTAKHAATVLASLDPAEAERAIAAALREIVNATSVDPVRLRTYPPQLLVGKPARASGAPSRSIWVRVRDLDRHVTHEVVVARGRVTTYNVDGSTNPPLSDEELAAAREALERDPTLADHLRQPDRDVQWFRPGHGPRRLAGARIVRLDHDQVAEVVATAVVDVDTATIVQEGDHHG